MAAIMNYYKLGHLKNTNLLSHSYLTAVEAKSVK